MKICDYMFKFDGRRENCCTINCSCDKKRRRWIKGKIQLYICLEWDRVEDCELTILNIWICPRSGRFASSTEKKYKYINK